MKGKVAFQTNKPVTVALAYPDGIQVEGRYGDQVMYTLADERVMYVPPIVRNRIAELGIGKGESVTICKAERRKGTRRFVEWQVARAGMNGAHAAAAATGANVSANSAVVWTIELHRPQPQTHKEKRDVRNKHIDCTRR